MRCQGLALALRLVYATCLMVGAASHLSLLIRHGWDWNYGGMPIGTVMFWSSLTVLDPVAAVLLVARPRVGVLCTLVIVLADVAHNGVVVGLRTGADYRLIDQTAFLLVVLASIRFVWRNSSA